MNMGTKVLPIFPDDMGYSDSVAALLDSKKSLVLGILEEHFGDIVRDVADFLLNNANVKLNFKLNNAIPKKKLIVKKEALISPNKTFFLSL